MEREIFLGVAAAISYMIFCAVIGSVIGFIIIRAGVKIRAFLWSRAWELDRAGRERARIIQKERLDGVHPIMDVLRREGHIITHIR